MSDSTYKRERRVAQRRETPTSLSYRGVLEILTDVGITQAEMAKAVGASTRTVQNWVSGANPPRGKNAERLLDLHTIVDVLRDSYTPEGIKIWLRSRNLNLDLQRPIDLLLSGEATAVLDEARWVAGGM
jgi:DNA-binding transcriptional regulator YiaG